MKNYFVFGPTDECLISLVVAKTTAQQSFEFVPGSGKVLLDFSYGITQ